MCYKLAASPGVHVLTTEVKLRRDLSQCTTEDKAYLLTKVIMPLIKQHREEELMVIFGSFTAAQNRAWVTNMTTNGPRSEDGRVAVPNDP